MPHTFKSTTIYWIRLPASIKITVKTLKQICSLGLYNYLVFSDTSPSLIGLRYVLDLRWYRRMAQEDIILSTWVYSA